MTAGRLRLTTVGFRPTTNGRHRLPRRLRWWPLQTADPGINRTLTVDGHSPSMGSSTPIDEGVPVCSAHADRTGTWRSELADGDGRYRGDSCRPLGRRRRSIGTDHSEWAQGRAALERLV